MTLQENIRLILSKFPQARHSRGEFAWCYLQEFYDVSVGVFKEKFKEFFQSWAGVERAYREVLKEPEFKLSPEEEAKRYKKASEFKKEYAKT